MINRELRRVLFVDDDPMVRAANLQTLALANLDAEAHADAASALACVDKDFPGVIITDVRMPGMDGLALFRRLKAVDPELPVILVTGHGDVPMAVSALKDGVWDFLTKPFASDQLVASTRRALMARRLVLENRALRTAAEVAADGDPLVGETPVMIQLRKTLRQLAATNVDVLIEGETGTGKELVATLLHRWSGRRGRPFLTFDCGALPLPLAQSELFGHRDGVIPGLRLSRTGRIEAADGGTLFLDALDAMPLELQAGMLRVLEEREVTPLGSDHPYTVDVRFVAAVARPAGQLVSRGALREDLFFRLDTVRLHLPPLRDRRDDIPLLFAHLLEQAAKRYRLPQPELDVESRTYLLSHDWPGNVRELAHYAERLVLEVKTTPPTCSTLTLPERTRRFEAEAIRTALASQGGDVRAAIKELGIPRKTFYDKLSRYGILPRDFRRGEEREP
ncbi:sigma-54-dependent transcriptional regulator [Sphingomonas quercus]|uniref:Sigma-54 dependent transcriptional regulator n=1 Tax=Sphingomonas quercus TaxID=2842451 RepID=A0ABS6BHU3_9SPHN|nr:sigma-54 dependent transcriptional regulator [Sphingomonas quercus]MBU3077882.1 sigma-54 dependent transcriptional regulator [Sphingomonas quercus]